MKWCDFNCEHAGFPDVELLGACRTMAAVFCKKLGKVVPKHTPCKAEEGLGQGAEGSRGKGLLELKSQNAEPPPKLRG